MRRAFVMVLALSAVAAAARAEDVDPEPPGNGRAELRKLRGKWTVTRLRWRGPEKKSSLTPTYSFDGDKMTLGNGRVPDVAKVKIDVKKKPFTLQITGEDVRTTVRWAFKFDSGTLLVVANPAAREDFSGNNGPVMVLERQKK
jgi:uncharacterized protein (TIGR03067 family)